jgi:hypothetical protein
MNSFIPIPRIQVETETQHFVPRSSGPIIESMMAVVSFSLSLTPSSAIQRIGVMGKR